MAFFNGLKTFIFLVSSVLLYPVLALLCVLVVYVVWLLGRFLGEWASRARHGEFEPRRDSAMRFPFPAPVARYREALRQLDPTDDAAIAYLMRRAISERQDSLDRFRLLIRLGPALGLLGTLIPMGTALVSVGKGDFNLVSGELIVAFTTTVVGLATGSVAFAMHLLHRRWIASDIRQIEFITEKFANEVHAQK